MQHISLETAKRLHSLGWSRPKCFVYALLKDCEDAGHGVIYVGSGSLYYDHEYHSVYAAPLTEELLEVLPRSTYLKKGYDGLYYTEHVHRNDEDVFLSYKSFSDIPAEALALLLIELVEQGVVSKDALQSKQ